MNIVKCNDYVTFYIDGLDINIDAPAFIEGDYYHCMVSVCIRGVDPNYSITAGYVRRVAEVIAKALKNNREFIIEWGASRDAFISIAIAAYYFDGALNDADKLNVNSDVFIDSLDAFVKSIAKEGV